MDTKKPTVEELLKKIEAWLGVQSLYLLTTLPSNSSCVAAMPGKPSEMCL